VWLTFSNRLCARHVISGRIWSLTVTTIADLRAIAELRNKTVAETSPPSPRRERRASHRFQVADSSPVEFVGSDACVVCGYPEASHIGLTAPEQHVMTELLNQLQASPFMRRRILRKLDAS
jgi:hypothetical protein